MKQTLETIEIDDEKETAKIEKALKKAERLCNREIYGERTAQLGLAAMAYQFAAGFGLIISGGPNSPLWPELPIVSAAIGAPLACYLGYRLGRQTDLVGKEGIYAGAVEAYPLFPGTASSLMACAQPFLFGLGMFAGLPWM